MTRGRLFGRVGLVAGLALVMFAVGALAGGIGRTEPGIAVTRAAVAPAEARGGADVDAGIAAHQRRLKQLPGDWAAWAALGTLYTAQARLTADPTYYAKADGAFARSLQIRPDGNAAALTGQATLAASRHDFAGALDLTGRSERLDAYSSTNLGVRYDALIELGRYPEAFDVLQRMVDLKPGVASYTRVSYSYQLRGDTRGATYALTRALEVAQSPSDAAFVLQFLGELAFDTGDLAAAARHFDAGLQRDPSYVPLLAGRARVEAAQGRTAAAVRTWQDVTTRLPQPTYLIEYADLLAGLGRTEEAAAQYSLVEAAAKLFRSQGANVDLELALFDADRGRPGPALAAAGAELGRRHSIHVEDSYAWALHAAGRDAEALVHAKRAGALGMRNALFAYHRGMIEKSLGQRSAAIASLRRALAINPHFSPLQARAARAALVELEGGR